MADFLDVNSANSALTAALDQINQSRQHMSAAAQKSQLETTEILNQSTLLLQDLNLKRQSVSNDIAAAMDTLDKINEMPKIAGKLGAALGIDDWNPILQERKIISNFEKLRMYNEDAVNNLKVNEMRMNVANLPLNTATANYNTARQGLVDLITGTSAANDLENVKNRRIVDEIGKLPDATIETAYAAMRGKSPKEIAALPDIPDVLKQNPGLLQNTYIQRTSAKAGLDAQQGQNIAREFATRELMRQEWFAGKQTDALLGYSTGKSKLSEVEQKLVTPQQIEDELRRRKELDINLKQHELALNANNLELQQASKNVAGMKASLTEVTDALKTAGASGSASLHGITMTANELKLLTDKKIAEETARTKIATETNINYAMAKSNVENGDFKVMLLTSEQGGKDFESARIVNEYNAKMKIAEARGDGVTFANLAAERYQKINELVETHIKNADKADQAALREFFNKGRVSTTASATQALTKSAFNGDAITNPAYAAAWNLFSTKATELRTNEFGALMQMHDVVNPTTGKTIPGITRGKETDPELFTRKVLDQSGAKNVFADTALQDLLGVAGAELRKQTASITNTKMPWNDMFLDNGRISNNYYTIDESGRRVWNAQKMLDDLAARTYEARKAGVLDANQSFTEHLFAQIRAIQDRFVQTQYAENNSLESSFALMLTNHRPANLIAARVAELEQKGMQVLTSQVKDLTQESVKGEVEDAIIRGDEAFLSNFRFK
jgi:hypothetical protein